MDPLASVSDPIAVAFGTASVAPPPPAETPPPPSPPPEGTGTVVDTYA